MNTAEFRPVLRAHRLILQSAASVVLGAFVLAGCGRHDDLAASRRNAVAEAKGKAKELREDAAEGVDKARVAAHGMAQDVKEASRDVGGRMGDKVSDAVVATSISAELAKDSSLSAMKIDVDAEGGRVTLRGTAPSAAARSHATSLASGVKGVASVDNELTIEPPK